MIYKAEQKRTEVYLCKNSGKTSSTGVYKESGRV